MKAMLLREIAPLTKNPKPLTVEDVPEPKPNADEVLIRSLGVRSLPHGIG